MSLSKPEIPVERKSAKWKNKPIFTLALVRAVMANYFYGLFGDALKIMKARAVDAANDILLKYGYLAEVQEKTLADPLNNIIKLWLRKPEDERFQYVREQMPEMVRGYHVMRARTPGFNGGAGGAGGAGGGEKREKREKGEKGEKGEKSKGEGAAVAAASDKGKEEMDDGEMKQMEEDEEREELQQKQMEDMWLEEKQMQEMHAEHEKEEQEPPRSLKKRTRSPSPVRVQRLVAGFIASCNDAMALCAPPQVGHQQTPDMSHEEPPTKLQAVGAEQADDDDVAAVITVSLEEFRKKHRAGRKIKLAKVNDYIDNETAKALDADNLHPVITLPPLNNMAPETRTILFTELSARFPNCIWYERFLPDGVSIDWVHVPHGALVPDAEAYQLRL
jgi:hypothetical protein